MNGRKNFMDAPRINVCRLLGSGGYHSGDEAAPRPRTDDVVFSNVFTSYIRALATALRHRALLLMVQKNPEHEAVRDEQQRHDQRGKEVGRGQLPRREACGISLVEG